jgi:DNA-directed RNA polymerase specialized sigma24 family protein
MIEPTSLSATPEAADASTFEAFFLAQHERLFQALYLLTSDRFEADDLAQEALLRTYERWDRVSAMESPAGYVYRTALNLYRSRLRSLLVRMRRGSPLSRARTLASLFRRAMTSEWQSRGCLAASESP